MRFLMVSVGKVYISLFSNWLTLELLRHVKSLKELLWIYHDLFSIILFQMSEFYLMMMIY